MPLVLRSVLLNVLAEGYFYTCRPCKDVVTCAQLPSLLGALITEAIAFADEKLPAYLDDESDQLCADYLSGAVLPSLTLFFRHHYRASALPDLDSMRFDELGDALDAFSGAAQLQPELFAAAEVAALIEVLKLHGLLTDALWERTMSTLHGGERASAAAAEHPPRGELSAGQSLGGRPLPLHFSERSAAGGMPPRASDDSGGAGGGAEVVGGGTSLATAGALLGARAEGAADPLGAHPMEHLREHFDAWYAGIDGASEFEALAAVFREGLEAAVAAAVLERKWPAMRRSKQRGSTAAGARLFPAVLSRQDLKRLSPAYLKRLISQFTDMPAAEFGGGGGGGGGVEEDSAALGEDALVLLGVLQSVLQRGSAEQLPQRQAILNELGCSTVALKMAACEERELCHAGLRLASSLLEGGHAEVHSSPDLH